MTEIAFRLKLAPNNSARYSTSGPTRSLMQNSSSVYEPHRLKFVEQEVEHQYRHHHKRKKSKKKRDRSSERHSSSSSSSRSRKHLEDQYHQNTSGASNDMHSVGLPSSDGLGGLKFDLIQDEDDDEDGEFGGGGGQDLLLDGPRENRKRKRDDSFSSITDDNNGKASKRSNNGDSTHYLFDQPLQQSLMFRTTDESRAEVTAPLPGSDEEDDDDFCLVSEEDPFNSYPYTNSDTTSNNVSVVINNYGENDVEERVEVMSDDDEDDDEEDQDDKNDVVTTAATTTTPLHQDIHLEGPRFEESFKYQLNHQEEEEDRDSLLEDHEEGKNIRSSDVVKNEINHVNQEFENEVDELGEVTSCSHVDVESLHSDRIPNVNGNFDSNGEFHEWHQSYAVESYSGGEPLHILPYAVIDF